MKQNNFFDSKNKNWDFFSYIDINNYITPTPIHKGIFNIFSILPLPSS